MSDDAISAMFLILQFAQVKPFIAIVCRCKENGDWEGRLGMRTVARK
jgi:hypothetical protein